MKKKQGITLIALIITIILMLILAGVVISLALGEKGLMNIAKYTVTKNNEVVSREKLEILLLNMQAEKETNDKYDKDDYLTSKIEEQDMTVIDEDIVFVDGWIFKIDRNVPEISESIGKFKEHDTISSLTLDNEEIIIGVTNQENIDIENVTKINVITEGIEKGQYKWTTKDKNIATIDSNGNITPVASGETQIECKSIDGKKVYATCKLTVEEREYLYYHGTSIVEFDNPLCGKNTILSGSPYFMDEYIYSKASNKNHPNQSQMINFLTKNEIDFSGYKGVGIKETVNVTGRESEWIGFNLVQTKTCNSWGAIDYNDSTGFTCIEIGELFSRIDGTDYADIEEYNNEYYLNHYINFGEYQSGIASTADIYIYEIFLVK